MPKEKFNNLYLILASVIIIIVLTPILVITLLVKGAKKDGDSTQPINSPIPTQATNLFPTGINIELVSPTPKTIDLGTRLDINSPTPTPTPSVIDDEKVQFKIPNN